MDGQGTEEACMDPPAERRLSRRLSLTSTDAAPLSPQRRPRASTAWDEESALEDLALPGPASPTGRRRALTDPQILVPEFLKRKSSGGLDALNASWREDSVDQKAELQQADCDCCPTPSPRMEGSTWDEDGPPSPLKLPMAATAAARLAVGTSAAASNQNNSPPKTYKPFWRKALNVVRATLETPIRMEPKDYDTVLPRCPATSEGRLDNGLTYFVRSCKKPPGRAVLRLVVRAGSVHEEDDQLGLAHFLEHAAFLKTKSFGKGELIKYIESTGASFGPDLNAHTSFSETVFKLDNIAIEEGQLDKGKYDLCAAVQ